MIGLGSNRMSVCRRGGMSVTQAGRGGMEWLAGGRGVSPYSAQATAALKAQFPTQWPTIRDYGFAHPALVPFINEDPMLVMSLIEGLGTRWLVGDGNSWIDTGVKATPATIAKTKVKYNSAVNTSMSMFGVRTSAADNATAFYVAYSAAWVSVEIRQFNGSNVERSIVLSDGIYDVTLKPNEFILNGTSYSAGTNIGSQYNIYAMTVRNGEAGSFTDKMRGQGMAFLSLESTSGGDRYFVPCKNPNGSDYGMLDTVNARWYANAGSGSFTISESPS